MLIVRTPDGRLTWLQAIASRRKAAVAAGIPAAFAGWLITDGYTGYQHLLSRLAGIQQCCAHVIRRCPGCPAAGAPGRHELSSDKPRIPATARPPEPISRSVMNVPYLTRRPAALRFPVRRGNFLLWRTYPAIWRGYFFLVISRDCAG